MEVGNRIIKEAFTDLLHITETHNSSRYRDATGVRSSAAMHFQMSMMARMAAVAEAHA